MSRGPEDQEAAAAAQADSPDIEALRLFAEIGRRLNSAKASAEPELLAAYAWLQLHGSRDDQALDRASGLLREALSSSPSASLRARLLNDLGCIELALSAPDRPLPLVAALGHLEQSVQLDGNRPESLYNRSLALDRLHLREQAESAWNDFLEVEPSGPWVVQARDQLARLQVEVEPTADDFWRVGVKESELRQWVVEHPYPARLAFEEGWLGLWLVALDSGDEVRRFELEQQAEVVGETLGERGAFLVADAVRAIKDLGMSLHRQAGIESLRRFEDGMIRYRRSEHGDAGPILADASQQLVGWNPALSHLASLYSWICVYFEDAEAARPGFEDLLDEVSSNADRLPSVVARVHWMLATIDLVQRRLETSLAHAQQMHSLLLASSGLRRAAIADGLIAEALEDRGELERSWRHRLLILGAYRSSSDHRRRQALLYETAQALNRRGESLQALAVLRESLAEAVQMGVRYGVAEAHSALARAHWALGDAAAARREVESAREALSAMPADQPQTRRTAAVVRFTEGLTHTSDDPERAVMDLQEAFDALESGGWSVETQLYHRAMADAELALNRPEVARKWLELSVQEVSRLRSESKNAMSRVEIFHHTQPTFDRLLALDLGSMPVEPARLTRLFANAERARKREFGGADLAETSVDPYEIAAALPEGTALIAYTVLPDRLLVWSLMGGEVSLDEVDVSRSDLRERSDLLLRAAESGSGAEVFERLAASLYDVLIRPAEEAVQGSTRWLVVPDMFLDRLPFGALFDRSTGNFLVEDLVVSQLPAARTLGGAGSSEMPPEGLGTLAVGVSRPGGGLPDLPDAGTEAAAVAAGYSSAALLLDTKQANGKGLKRRLLQEIPARDVFHFAGHSTVDLRSGQAYLHLGDGETLSTEELLNHDLSGLRLAVLSACRTGIGREWGREGTVSLQNVFLAAGTQAVVASTWQVDDQLTRELMTRFHEEFQRSGDAAEALRAAQLESLNKQDSPLRDPAVWAAFVVSGR